MYDICLLTVSVVYDDTTTTALLGPTAAAAM